MIRVEIDPRQELILPPPDPSGPYGRSVLVPQKHEVTAFVSDEPMPDTILMREERFQMVKMGIPRWHQAYANEAGGVEYGYYEMTSWYTWQRVIPDVENGMDMTKWDMQQQIVELRRTVKMLEDRLEFEARTNLGGLYREMMRDSAQETGGIEDVHKGPDGSLPDTAEL